MDLDHEEPAFNGSPLHFARRADDYTYRVPTPPRIVVPPPALDNNAYPDFTLSTLSNAREPQVKYTNLVTQNALIDWTYTKRREAQMILPYLFLGPMSAARDPQFLQNSGMTIVIGIRHKTSSSSNAMNSFPALRPAIDLNLETHAIDLISNQELIASFPVINNLISSHLNSQKKKLAFQNSYTSLTPTHPVPEPKVLLFCESGNERSAGACAAYLMAAHADVDHVRAMQLVQAQRFCVCFNEEMKRLLQGYWDILCAGRQCGGAGVVGARKSKRGLEMEDETIANAENDVARFEGRNFAPFLDSVDAMES